MDSGPLVADDHVIARDDPRRGPRERLKPHISGGRKDSRHESFRASKRAHRDSFPALNKARISKTRTRSKGDVPACHRVVILCIV